MPFIFIFQEWEYPLTQKIENAFPNTLKSAICKLRLEPKFGRKRKNIGILKDL
jgi:hypothetical protein